MRVAIVHHWFVTRGGGERVAECLAGLFPRAEIFTLVSSPHGTPASFASRVVRTSFLQQLPMAATHHRHMMPFYAMATRGLDLRKFDLVLSSDSGPVKGVRTHPGAVHICYCHSPMRYLYDSYDSYRAGMPGLARALFTLSAGPLRNFDRAAASRVTRFVANSNYVAERIRRYYHRDSTVVHPPIDLSLSRFAEPQDHYLCAGRLVPYKRTEVLLQACRQLGRKLRIAGSGPEEARLRRLAAGDANVTFLGELDNEALWQQYACCRALLFAADEDFGMVPLEAQSCGRPVVAYGAGGSLETIRVDGPAPTGIFYPHQTVESLCDGIRQFESEDAGGRFQPQAIHDWSEQFRTEVFLDRMRRVVLESCPAAATEMA